MNMTRSVSRIIFAIPLFLVNWTTTAFAGPAAAGAGAAAINNDVYSDDTFSQIFERMGDSFVGAPGLISAAAYITAMILAVMAILKLKEFIDNPAQNSIRESLARALIAGALFAMPTIIDTVTSTIGSQAGGVEVRQLVFDPGAIAAGGVANAVGGALGGGFCDGLKALNVLNAGVGGAAGGGGIGGAVGGAVGALVNGGTLGEAICFAAQSFQGLPELLGVILYLSGLFLVFWALLQLRDHIISPDRAPVSVPLKKLLVAGAFFAFPSVIEVVQNSVAGDGEGLFAIDPGTTLACAVGGAGGLMNMIGQIGNLIQGNAGAAQAQGLDCMMVRLITDIWAPFQIAVSIFAYIAGLILIALALRRMMDGMDKGVRSPVGIGTLSMFAVGGALLSFDLIIRIVSVSLLPDAFAMVGLAKLSLYGSLSYAPGIDDNAAKSINSVISTVFMFSFLVGIISVMRGLFILKEVSNGGNASLMAGFTHLLGGGLAVNLGAVVNAIQNTLGLSDVGLKVGTTMFGI